MSSQAKLPIHQRVNLKLILNAFAKKGYPLPNGTDIAFFGVRSSVRTTDNFDDVIGYIRRKPDGGWEINTYVGTTDPGRPYTMKPINPKGAAIMVEGHYPNLWSRGVHRGKVQAFVQTGKVSVYRDNDKDTILDLDASSVESGFFGINLHDAYSPDLAKNVGKWSAGCQVLQRSSQLAALVKMADAHKQKHYSYSLFNEHDVLPENS